MKFSSAITFITLAASSVYGNAIDISARDANTAALQDANTLESRATCSNSDMQAVRDRINHYNVFCQAFNAQPRDASPLPTLSSSQLASACSCLIAQWNKKSNPTSGGSSGSTCTNSDNTLLKNEAPKNYNSYCKWWGSRSRTISAIPGISVNQLNKSCKCLLASLANTATTAVKATTTKTTAKATSAAKATAPACKKRRKNRRTVTVEVSAEATAAF